MRVFVELDPGVVQQLGDCGSVLRFFVHASRDEIPELRTEEPVVRQLRRAHVLQVLDKLNEVRQLRVRVDPGRQLDDRQAEAPNVACVGVGVAEDPLGAHVYHRPDERVAKRSRVRKLTADSEVAELYFPAGTDEHVVRLYVAVDHVLFFVQVVKAAQDGGDEVEEDRFWHDWLGMTCD